MIRVTVMYPNTPGARFDHEYFAGKHGDLVRARFGSALVSFETNKGLGGATPGSPAPFEAAAQLVFNSMDDFQKAFGQHGGEIMGDIPNYTDIKPQVQISEITTG